jgi:hypothetical protein
MAPADDVDWFGNPLDHQGRAPRAPVPCPRCGEAFTDAPALRVHLAELHAAPTRTRPARPSHLTRLRRFADSLRFLSPWFVVPLNLAFTLVLWVALGRPAELFSFDHPDRVLATWAVRLSLLPVTLYLGVRVAGGGRR